MRHYIARMAIAGFALMAVGSVAKAEVITCPITQANRTIVTTLPADWWTTPIVADLSNTQIINIGGQTALQCVYGPAGAIQRYAPLNTVCTTLPTGFDCLPIIVVIPTPITFSTGIINWQQTFLINVDNGVVQSAGADLWLQAETATALYIVPQNGAVIGLGDRSNRGFAGCAAETMTANRVPLAAIPVGSYVCVRTDQGRISQFRMNAISPTSPRVLTIGYTTWQ